MITDKSNGRLAEIKAYAQKNNLPESFNNTFSRFGNSLAKGYTVTLYSDFAPLSMKFSITKNDKLILYGGFNFPKPHDGYENGGAPSFSVSLSQDKVTGWSIHT